MKQKAKENPKVRGMIEQIFTPGIYTPRHEDSWLSARGWDSEKQSY